VQRGLLNCSRTGCSLPPRLDVSGSKSRRRTPRSITNKRETRRSNRRARRSTNQITQTVLSGMSMALSFDAYVCNQTVGTGSASDLLRLCAESARDDIARGGAWAKSPRACLTHHSSMPISLARRSWIGAQRLGFAILGFFRHAPSAPLRSANDHPTIFMINAIPQTEGANQ
jgi:hypothetical protein